MSQPFADSINIGRLAARVLELKLHAADFDQQQHKRASDDFRRTVFGKIANICDATALAYMFQARRLMHSKWWYSDNGLIAIPPDAPSRKIQITVDTFFGVTRCGFTHSVFSQVETSLRAFLRAIAPGAVSHGTGEFKSVYDCLLKTHLSRAEGWHDQIEQLDFFRAIRNLIHNNGVYLSRRGRDLDVKHRGISYVFTHDQQIDFLPMPIVFDLIEDILDALADIVSHPRLLAYMEVIRDPVVKDYAKVED